MSFRARAKKRRGTAAEREGGPTGGCARRERSASAAPPLPHASRAAGAAHAGRRRRVPLEYPLGQRAAAVPRARGVPRRFRGFGAVARRGGAVGQCVGWSEGAGGRRTIV